MKIFLAVVGTALAQQSLPFECPAGKILQFGASGLVDEATCCGTGSPTPAPDPLTPCEACNGTQVNLYAKTSNPNQCVCRDPTCAGTKPFADPDAQSDDPLAAAYDCPVGKTLNYGNSQNTTLDEATCCEAGSVWEPRCGYTQSTQPTAPDDYKFFNCASGTTINPTTFSSRNLTQESCCSVFEPTCVWKSGPVTAPIAFDCPAGKIANEANGLSKTVTEASCCSDFTATCDFKNDNGDRFTCPAGKIESSNFVGLPSPSEAICCTTTGRTCFAAEQNKCEAVECGATRESSGKTGAFNSQAECCQKIPAGGDSSGAGSLVLGLALVAPVLF